MIQILKHREAVVIALLVALVLLIGATSARTSYSRRRSSTWPIPASC